MAAVIAHAYGYLFRIEKYVCGMDGGETGRVGYGGTVEYGGEDGLEAGAVGSGFAGIYVAVCLHVLLVGQKASVGGVCWWGLGEKGEKFTSPSWAGISSSGFRE